MRDKVRLAIVGTGGVANAHAQAHRHNADAVEIVALADIVPGKAAEFARRHGLTTATLCEHYEEALALPAVDAIDICLVPEVHGPAALAALEAGKHVLCEKPMALSLAEARQMSDRASATGLVNMVDFTYRYYPVARFVRRLIDEGDLGEIVRVRSQYIMQVPARWASRPVNTTSPALNIIGDLGSHVIDLLRFFAGEIVSVSGQHRVKPGRGESADAIVEFASGATGSVEASSVVTDRSGHFRRVEVHGTTGAATIDYFRPGIVQLYLRGGIAAHLPGGVTTVRVPGVAWGEQCTDEIEHLAWVEGLANASKLFAQGVAGQRDAAVATFYDGYRAQVIMEAIAESSATGNRVMVAPPSA